jgi:hypothetical protein
MGGNVRKNLLYFFGRGSMFGKIDQGVLFSLEGYLPLEERIDQPVFGLGPPAPSIDLLLRGNQRLGV